MLPSMSPEENRLLIGRWFFFAFVLGSVSDQNATNEDGSVERPAEQLISQLPQATRAVSKVRTNPARLASPRKAIERNISGAGDQGLKGRNPPTQPRRGGTKGDPRRGSLHPLARAAGRAAKGRAARRGYTPRCREPADGDGDGSGEVYGVIMARVSDCITWAKLLYMTKKMLYMTIFFVDLLAYIKKKQYLCSVFLKPIKKGYFYGK